MGGTTPNITVNPTATENRATPTQEEISSGEAYPSPTMNDNNEPYPQPLNPGISQPYPQPNITENPQPYPQPSSAGTLPTQPIVTPLAGAMQATVMPLTGTVQPSSNQATVSVVDVSLHATDPSTVQLASGGYQLIEFFAFWCPTCKSMAPVMNLLEKKYISKIRFVFLDIDDPRTAKFKQALGYQYQPHLFLIDGGGKIVKQWIGGVSQEELENSLNSIQ
ncbi:MAG: thioredoxin domain-containing protein [Anaerolineales bacterium]